MLALESNALGDPAAVPSVANLTTGIALAYLDLRLPYLNWRQRAPSLIEWFDAFAARPSMLATEPPAAK